MKDRIKIDFSWRITPLAFFVVLIGLIAMGYMLFSPVNSQSDAMAKKPPDVIQMVEVVKASKEITIVPGDIITESTPFESSQIDCTGYTVANLIMHVKNLSSTETNKFFARATFGPIGSLSEVDVIEYNRPMPPLSSFVWRAVVPVYSTYFKVYYSMEGLGSIDINNKAVLGTGSSPNP